MKAFLKRISVMKNTASDIQPVISLHVDVENPIHIEQVKILYQDKHENNKLIFISGWSRIEPRISLETDSERIIFTPKYRPREDLDQGNLEFSGHFIMPSNCRKALVKSGNSTFQIDVGKLAVETNLKTAHTALIEMFKIQKATFLQSELIEISNWLLTSYLPIIKCVHRDMISRVQITKLGFPESESLKPISIIVLNNIWEGIGHMVLAAKEDRKNLACLISHELTAQEKTIFEGIAKSYGLSLVVVSRTDQNLVTSIVHLKNELGFLSCNIHFYQGMNLQKFQAINRDETHDSSSREDIRVELNFPNLDLNCQNYIGDFLSNHVQISYLSDRFGLIEQENSLKNRIIENVDCYQIEELALRLIQQEEMRY